MPHPDPLHDFLEAASAPLDAHASGSLDTANALLADHPDLARNSIYAAAVLGDESAINDALAADPSASTAKGGPRNWDALTYLCFSRYLRLDRARSESFVRSARALLDSGADPNTGWFEANHQPTPMWESAIYGAAGVAHHAGVTQVLIERGADPNDDETPYHSPETHDSAALKVLVESGKLNSRSLTMILLRKTDWHDADAIKWLLERGVDPNLTSDWGKTAFHNAILSDNALTIVDALLDYGANPALIASQPDRARDSGPGMSAIALAAWRGRGDVLRSLDRRGIPLELEGVARLVALCAINDRDGVAASVSEEPKLVEQLHAKAGLLLTKFAGNGNTEGIERLLELGLPIDALNGRGEGYFDVAPMSTALHVAAWRARHGTVKMLIDRGADVNRLDGKGRSPLALAIKACVDSYWSDRRSSESIAALLAAGASKQDIRVPTGYPEADKLLASATT